MAAGCASTPRPPNTPYRPSPPATDEPGGECVPFARNHSKVKLFGDAYTWWDQAKNHYARRMIPTKGAVMVLHNYAGTSRAHVAVVTGIINPHEIRVDHANWFNDGKIYKNNPVRDASPNRDWSMVNVYNMPGGGWGVRNYEVQGFIGPDKPAPPNHEDDISGLFSNAAPDFPASDTDIALAQPTPVKTNPATLGTAETGPVLAARHP
ncbi:MAG: CHAP domain-containing protein [Rhizomicrobium sp.]